MIITVDTREPPKYYTFLKRTFPNLHFENNKLNEGDYATEYVLVERKTIADLYGSIIGSKGKEGRLLKQLDRLATHDNQITLLLVTGSAERYQKDMRDIGINVDVDILHGEMASASCRYGINTWWIEHEESALINMVKFMKKVDEGKYLVPSRRDPDILSARLLGVTLDQWWGLKSKFGNLHAMASASEPMLQSIKGIGPAKAKKIRNVLRS